MYRRAAAIDPDLTHLWVEDDTTICGYTGDHYPAYGTCMCQPCIDRYGAELAAAFSYLSWLARPGGLTRHAFDPDETPTGSGRVWPVCRIRTYAPDQLRPDPRVMRCPHCITHLRHRKPSGK